MRINFIFFVLGFIFSSPAFSFTDERQEWNESLHPLKGEYLIYAGTLDNSTRPTRNDRKVSLKRGSSLVLPSKLMQNFINIDART